MAFFLAFLASLKTWMTGLPQSCYPQIFLVWVVWGQGPASWEEDIATWGKFSPDTTIQTPSQHKQMPHGLTQMAGLACSHGLPFVTVIFFIFFPSLGTEARPLYARQEFYQHTMPSFYFLRQGLTKLYNLWSYFVAQAGPELTFLLPQYPSSLVHRITGLCC